MKLTLKDLELLNTASAYNGEQHRAICGKAVLELIEYKKIEEKLGIDLTTLYQCFVSTKFYVKNLFNEIIEVKSDIVRFDIGNGYVYFGTDYCPLSSYGKTWATNKEDLE